MNLVANLFEENWKWYESFLLRIQWNYFEIFSEWTKRNSNSWTNIWKYKNAINGYIMSMNGDEMF